MGGDNRNTSNGYQNGGAVHDHNQHPVPTWNATNSYPLQTDTLQQETTPSQSLEALTPGTCGSNYLGVLGNSKLSAIKGTALTILGMKIDIADFDSFDMDEPKDCTNIDPELYNKSYQSFLQTAFNVNHKIAHAELPSREEAFQLAGCYFRALNPYSPIIHEPSFMALVCLVICCMNTANLSSWHESMTIPNFDQLPQKMSSCTWSSPSCISTFPSARNLVLR